MNKDEGNHVFVVRDRDRQLSFEGEKLAESSSRSRGRTRWVEFELYRTKSGQYVIARTGVSLYFHREGCPVIKRNSIKAVHSEDLPSGLVPCETCMPIIANEDELYPETARYWAQVCTTPQCVIEGLYKYDENDARYLTNVARSLLIEAAGNDDEIYDVFFNEHVS